MKPTISTSPQVVETRGPAPSSPSLRLGRRVDRAGASPCSDRRRAQPAPHGHEGEARAARSPRPRQPVAARAPRRPPPPRPRRGPGARHARRPVPQRRSDAGRRARGRRIGSGATGSGATASGRGSATRARRPGGPDRRVANRTPTSITTRLVSAGHHERDGHALDTPAADADGSAGASVTSETTSATVPRRGQPEPARAVGEDPAGGDEQRAHQEDPHEVDRVPERVAEEERHEQARGHLQSHHHRQAGRDRDR